MSDMDPNGILFSFSFTIAESGSQHPHSSNTDLDSRFQNGCQGQSYKDMDMDKDMDVKYLPRSYPVASVGHGPTNSGHQF
ncbi:hypothetical protein IFR05_002552 [Cadophora sp. M221]|nr:hypothetical protein IFR05_002552 [Cadophora sp. M221]